MTLINRKPAYVETVLKNGLVLDEAGRSDAVPVMAATGPEGLGPVDLLIVLVKSAADIRAVIWDKLLVNVATGALAAITGLDYGNLHDVPEIEQTALAAVAEAMAVARAAGVGLSTAAPREAWERAAQGLPSGFRTSMLQSLARGRVIADIAAETAAIRP